MDLGSDISSHEKQQWKHTQLKCEATLPPPPTPLAHCSPGSRYQMYRRLNDVKLIGTKFISVLGSIPKGGEGGGLSSLGDNAQQRNISGAKTEC